LSFEALEMDFDALKMNFVVVSGEKVVGEGDNGVTQSWVTARFMAGSGLVMQPNKAEANKIVQEER
jgi:hypothetical protein